MTTKTKKRELRVAYRGVPFCRTTAADYTYVVVSVPGAGQLRYAEAAVDNCRKLVRDGYGSWTKQELENSLAHALKTLASTRVAFERGEPTYITWHTRHDLALQEKAFRDNGGHGKRPDWFSHVAVVEVPAR
jgi:hypothetical protein